MLSQLTVGILKRLTTEAVRLPSAFLWEFAARACFSFIFQTEKEYAFELLIVVM